ncbi:MAG TPA: thioesterase-like protein [Rhodospirillales bacterium]|nr:thioesterase-like protein [Rhodospirillales bacterium]
MTPFEETVQSNWIDYNGHMNVAYYLLVFDHASDTLLDQLELGAAYRAQKNCSMFVVETHITFDREVLEGELLRVENRIVGYGDKRLHIYQQMSGGATGEMAATNEVMLLHVDMSQRRTSRFPQGALDRIQSIFNSQEKPELPEGTGRSIRPC